MLPEVPIYVHNHRNRASDAPILFAKFREEDVRAGKLVSKHASLKALVRSAVSVNHDGADATTSRKEPK